MVDVDDEDDESIVMDLVDDPVGAPPRAPQALELALQRLADTSRVASQVAVHELDDRGDDARGDASQVSPSGPRELDLIGAVTGAAHRPVRRGTPNSARTSASREVVPAASS